MNNERAEITINEGEVQSEIDALAPWFHNIHLPTGEQTAPDHFLGDFPAFKWKELSTEIPEDLSGKKVLDIGCNAGFYSIELAKRGAEVLAIDLDPHYLKQAEWVARQFGLEDSITFKKMQIYDLAKEDVEFDLVWFMGVFYHLRYPLLAMDVVAEKMRGSMVFQTLTMPGKEVMEIAHDYDIHDRGKMIEKGWPKMAFIEKELNGDPTNWWAPNHAAIEAMLRTCGMNVTSRPSHETYICKKDSSTEAVSTGWNRSEYLSAIGRNWEEELNNKVSGK